MLLGSFGGNVKLRQWSNHYGIGGISFSLGLGSSLGGWTVKEYQYYGKSRNRLFGGLAHFSRSAPCLSAQAEFRLMLAWTNPAACIKLSATGGRG